jgi:hypothetical protein
MVSVADRRLRGQILKDQYISQEVLLQRRAARWLLLMHDRADGDEFAMTQDFLSMMLSVHRPAVNITARLFQQSRLISYGNGRLRVIDRPGLEASACECYAAVQEQFHQLLSLRPA